MAPIYLGKRVVPSSLRYIENLAYITLYNPPTDDNDINFMDIDMNSVRYVDTQDILEYWEMKLYLNMCRYTITFS